MNSHALLVGRPIGRGRIVSLVGILCAAVLIVVPVLGPQVTSHSPYAIDLLHIAEPPTASHWLGTDELGRDILSRVLSGARTSLLLACSVQLAATCIGIVVGLASGHARATVDAAIMAVVDGIYAFPPLVIVLVLVAILPAGVGSLILAFTAVSFLPPARLVRGQVVALREREFVIAARAAGASPLRVLVRHVLPNSLGAIFVQFTHGAAGVVMGEAALSYLGLGVLASQPSWGMMIAKGRDYVFTAPHIALWPTVAVTAAVICLNGLASVLRMYVGSRAKVWPL